MQKKYNSKMEDIIVCFGPSIRKCCFSSKENSFKERFTSIWKNESEYISYKEDRFFIDLVYVITRDLLELGIKEENIIDSKICTMCNSNDFFSNRASKKRNSDEFGTFALVTMLI